MTDNKNKRIHFTDRHTGKPFIIDPDCTEPVKIEEHTVYAGKLFNGTPFNRTDLTTVISLRTARIYNEILRRLYESDFQPIALDMNESSPVTITPVTNIQINVMTPEDYTDNTPANRAVYGTSLHANPDQAAFMRAGKTLQLRNVSHFEVSGPFPTVIVRHSLVQIAWEIADWKNTVETAKAYYKKYTSLVRKLAKTGFTYNDFEKGCEIMKFMKENDMKALHKSLKEKYARYFECSPEDIKQIYLNTKLFNEIPTYSRFLYDNAPGFNPLASATMIEENPLAQYTDILTDLKRKPVTVSEPVANQNTNQQSD